MFNNVATELTQLGHRDIVKSVSLDPTATRLISGSWDGTILLWDAVTGKTVRKPLTGHESGVRSAVFNSAGTRILSGSTDKTIRVWDTKRQMQVGAPFKAHQEHIYCVQYNRDDSLILSTSNDNTIRVWESTMMDNNTMIGATQQHQLFSGHLDCVYAAAFNHDGSLIASGTRDNTVRIWDTKTGNLAMEPLRGHTSCVRFVNFSKDGNHIVSGSEDGIVKVWDVKTGKSVDDIQSAEHAMCYNSLPLEGRGTHARIPFLGDMIGFTTSSPITIGICAAVFDTQHNVWRAAIGDGFRVHLLYLCDGLC